MKSGFNLAHTVVLVDWGGYVWTSEYGEDDFVFHSAMWGGRTLSYDRLIVERAPLHILYRGVPDRNKLPWIDKQGILRKKKKKS